MSKAKFTVEDFRLAQQALLETYNSLFTANKETPSNSTELVLMALQSSIVVMEQEIRFLKGEIKLTEDGVV